MCGWKLYVRGGQYPWQRPARVIVQRDQGVVPSSDTTVSFARWNHARLYAGHAGALRYAMIAGRTSLLVRQLRSTYAPVVDETWKDTPRSTSHRTAHMNVMTSLYFSVHPTAVPPCHLDRKLKTIWLLRTFDYCTKYGRQRDETESSKACGGCNFNEKLPTLL